MVKVARGWAVVAAAALALVVGSSVASAAQSGDGVFKTLHTRGGTIGCQFASGGGLRQPVLRCDIRGGLQPRPPRPASCAPNPNYDVVWAVGIILQTKGRAQVACAGDSTLGGPGQLLRHGTRWQAGGISCHMLAAQNMLCQNAVGHGFQLSPTRWRIF